ncbi:MAG: DUF5711 family protein [Eubacteriales bacterium]|nr:DUF5711 family protein [Eubacteriales bacterium]
MAKIEKIGSFFSGIGEKVSERTAERRMERQRKREARQNAESAAEEEVQSTGQNRGQSAENSGMTDLSEKLRQHQRKMRIRTAAVVAGVIVLAAGVITYRYVRVFHNYTILSTVENSEDAVTQYVSMGNNALKCSPNGVTCVDKSGKVLWNTSFTMKEPLVDSSDSITAVADRRGSNVYLFDKNGQLGTFDAEYTIVKMHVSSQGVVALILEDGDTTWVNMYNSQGEVLVKNRTSMAESGYPIDMDISSDATKMVVSFLGMDTENIVGKVVFYDFGSLGKSKTGNVVSTTEYSGHVVPQVTYLDDSYIVAYRDNGISFFSGSRVPEESVSIETEQEIISVFGDSDYVGLVQQNTSEDHDGKYLMQIYRKNGSKSTQIYFDIEYTSLKMEGDDIILYNASELEIYSSNGSHKFSGTYEKEIKNVSKLDGSRKYSVQTTDSLDEIRIR